MVTLNERVAGRQRAAAGLEVVRLHQPIDVPFTDPDVFTLPDRPRYGLLMAHRAGLVHRELAEACEARGIELRTVGGPGERVDDLTPYFMDADIVFAVGRTVLEGMSFGRAGFVIDDRGSGGFVTPETYQDLEAHGFVRSDPEPISARLLGEQLDRYEPSFGRSALEQVRRNHSSRVHARDLVRTYEEAVAAGPPPAVEAADALVAHADAVEEHFRLEFTLRNAEWRRSAMERRAHEHDVALQDLRAHLVDLQQAFEHRTAEVASLSERAARADELERQLDALRSSRVVRLLRPVRGLFARR